MELTPFEAHSLIKACEAISDNPSNGRYTEDEIKTATDLIPRLRERAGSVTDNNFVSAIGPASTGKWMIKTQNSRHLWNLDEGWYIRNPEKNSETLDEILRGFSGFNGRRIYWNDVQTWPSVGATFMVNLPQPYGFHRSSIIVSIERVS